MAEYQSFKLDMVKAFGISRDGFHILLGFFVFLLACHLFKIKLTSWKAVIAPLTFAVLLETMDMRDAIMFGHLVNYLDSFHDIIITMALPALTIFYVRFTKNDPTR